MDGQNSEDGAAEKEKSCTPPGFLFVQPKQRKKEYWQCIKLVAPTMEGKKWKVSEAVFVWCTLCDCKVKWKLGEVNFVKKHMETKHKLLLNMNEEEKKASIVNFFPTKEQRNKRPVSIADQKLGEVLLVKWVAESLRPFNIVEDNGFRDLAAVSCC